MKLASLRGREVVPISDEDYLGWARELKDTEHRRVAFDQLTDTIRVSTVFLGLNHGFNDGPPLWFETMAFGLEDDKLQERCETYEQAEQQHAKMLAQVKAKLAGGKF
jgi:hypothetical protein